VGIILPSHLKFGSQILFVRKADGSLRLCIDYRGLVNDATREDAYPFPRVDNILGELKDIHLDFYTQFYTHLDIAFGVGQVREHEEVVHNTAFHIAYGLMEWVAMPSGLCNAPTMFQRMINDNMSDFLHKFVKVYLDNVCI
jgi:hypothetical protein